MTMNNVLTVTLNPSVDMTYIVDDFLLNHVNRVSHVAKTAGGKGLNVSKVLNILDIPVTATGFVGGYNGQLLLSKLNDLNITTDFVDVPIETRNCISINSNGRTTEVLENTSPVPPQFKDVLLQKLASCDALDFVVISGSCVSGISKTIYYDIIKQFNEKHVPVILDASADILSEVINTDVEIYMIKPNQDEIAPLYVNGRFIHPKNVKYVIESRGDAGIVCHGKTKITVAAPKVETVSPVGSGDASIAGFIYGMPSGLTHALKCMVAAGSANAQEIETGHIQLENFKQLLENLEVIHDERLK